MANPLIKLASVLAPNAVVNFAYKQLTNPQVHKLRPHEQVVLDKAEQERVTIGSMEIQTYTWRGGNNPVLLVHGWEGQAGNFADLVEALLERGYTVHAFDAPSHGYSSKGPTSLFEFGDTVVAMMQRFGAHKLVSHSFGGVATTYALAQNTNIEVHRYALLTTPDTFRERINTVANAVGITEKVKNKLIDRLELETGLSVDVMRVSEFVTRVSVNKALILHDKADKVIQAAQSQNVVANWPQASLELIEGTGHFRILRTTSVHQRVIDFLDS